MFVYGEALLFNGSPMEIIFSIVTSIIGTVVLSIGLQGYTFTKHRVPTVARYTFICSAISLIFSGWKTDLVGLLFLIIALLLTKIFGKRLSEQDQYEI